MPKNKKIEHKSNWLNLGNHKPFWSTSVLENAGLTDLTIFFIGEDSELIEVAKSKFELNK